MSDEEGSPEARERRRRSIAIALVLAGLAILFFVMTIVRLQGHVTAFFQ
jgi:hypothetical protein